MLSPHQITDQWLSSTKLPSKPILHLSLSRFLNSQTLSFRSDFGCRIVCLLDLQENGGQDYHFVPAEVGRDCDHPSYHCGQDYHFVPGEVGRDCDHPSYHWHISYIFGRSRGPWKRKNTARG
nr:hypothetical protein CFP56_35667 [Quercus suber]